MFNLDNIIINYYNLQNLMIFFNYIYIYIYIYIYWTLSLNKFKYF